MFFEGFLANNVKFGSLEEVLHYIDNVCNEVGSRRYASEIVLDRPITVEECFSKIILTCGDWRKGKIRWIPDDEDMMIIYTTLANLPQDDINRLYYKNNLYSFLDNSSMTKALQYILKSLKSPYLEPGKVPTEIKVELDTLQDILREWVYYKYMYIDRIDRCDSMIKDVCAISDTDSTIVSFDAFYHYTLSKIEGMDIPVSKDPISVFDLDENLGLKKPMEFIPTKITYDFQNDDIIEVQQNIKPFEILPQNNLRFSIINIIAYIAGNLCNEYIVEYTKSNHSWQGEDVKCLLYLKNEFLFNRALLTPSKKNYATTRQLQEGVVIEQTQSASMDIKGLPINKSTLNSNIKKELQKILYEYILKPEEIDQVEIIKQLAVLEKKIEKSLKKGEKTYYKPMAIKALDSYDDPMRNQGIKASLIWNMTRDPDLEAIDLSSRNTIDIAKVSITPDNISCIKESHPAEYERLVQLFENPKLFDKGKLITATGLDKREISAIAIPINVETPDWVGNFIDYKTVISDSLKTFPIESVNITKLNSSSNYSNIMKI